MEIRITGRKMNVSDSLKAYANEKIESALKVFDISPISVEVVLHHEKNPANSRPAVAEITVRAKNHIIRSEESEEDIRAAIDVAAAKAERQLRKYKTKIVDRRNKSVHKPVVSPDFAEESLLGIADELLMEDDIIRVKDLELEPISQDDATIRMDLLGHDFYVYFDRDYDGVAVIYRRDDGGYGLIRTSVA
jgi:putative sigma-54 modulation protein